jgi:hypothetical protein
MERRFASVLSLWGGCEDLHMVIIATFRATDAGIPNVVELFLMPVTQHWLPIESGFEKQLLDQLALDGRSFVQGTSLRPCFVKCVGQRNADRLRGFGTGAIRCRRRRREQRARPSGERPFDSGVGVEPVERNDAHAAASTPTPYKRDRLQR